MNLFSFQKKLTTTWLGRVVHYEKTIDSTNTWALRELAQSPRGTLFVTDYQTTGRGRLTRAWEAPLGKNLLFSFVDDLPVKGPHLSLVTGVALAEGLGKVEMQLKWPNDLFYSGKKIGGILIEARQEKAVVGVGINVNMSVDDFSPEIREKSFSLKEIIGQDLSLEDLLISLLCSYEQARSLYDREGLAPFIKKWNQKNILKVITNETFSNAEVLGLDEDGFLLVKERGVVHKIIVGDT